MASRTLAMGYDQHTTSMQRQDQYTSSMWPVWAVWHDSESFNDPNPCCVVLVYIKACNQLIKVYRNMKNTGRKHVHNIII